MRMLHIFLFCVAGLRCLQTMKTTLYVRRKSVLSTRTPKSGPKRWSTTSLAVVNSPVTGPFPNMPGRSGEWSPTWRRSVLPMILAKPPPLPHCAAHPVVHPPETSPVASSLCTVTWFLLGTDLRTTSAASTLSHSRLLNLMGSFLLYIGGGGGGVTCSLQAHRSGVRRDSVRVILTLEVKHVSDVYVIHGTVWLHWEH